MSHDRVAPGDRLFKSVPREFDPRKIGTIRIGSLQFYQKHFDEAVKDPGEGSGVVSVYPDQDVTLPNLLVSALMGVEIKGENAASPGKLFIESEGVRFKQDLPNKKMTISGEGTWYFTALDALIFCMSAPSQEYMDTFPGDRIAWSIDRRDAQEFADLIQDGIDEAYPVEVSFPNASAAEARTCFNEYQHRPVDYSPRRHALDDTPAGRLAALLFTNSTFIKPSGPPRYFEREEEYRFQFRRALADGTSPTHLPEAVDVPFHLVEHLIRFED